MVVSTKSIKKNSIKNKDVCDLLSTNSIPVQLLIEYIINDAIIDIINPEEIDKDVTVNLTINLTECGYNIENNYIDSDILLSGCFGICNTYLIKVFNNPDNVIYKLFDGMVNRFRAMGFNVE